MPLYVTVFSSHRVYTKTGLYSSKHRAICSFFHITRFSNRLTHRLTVTVDLWRWPGSDQSDHWPASGPALSYRLQHLLMITSTAGLPVNCLIAGPPLCRLGHGMLLGRRCCPDVPCPVTPGIRPLKTGGRGHMGAATNSLQT